MNLNIKQEIKNLVLGILYTIALIVFIRWIKPTTLWLCIILIIASLLMSLFSYIKTHLKPKISQLFINMATIVGLVYLMSFLGKYEAFGWFLSVIIICLLILWTKRKKWLEVKHHIETMLWGKPLYKYREKGEKPPKIEIVR